MKFEVGRNELLSAVSAVVGVVERRQTLPILSNLLMRVDEERLTLVGTDLEIELTSFAQVRVLKTGEVTVPARKLFDICRGLPEGAEITLEAGEGRATLRSANSRFVLSTLEAQEFPSLDTEATAHAFSAPQGKLKALIDRTQFAMAAQDVRYYLNGLCIHLLPAAVRSVATDGHRLAMSEAAIPTGLDKDRQIIVPRKAVQELSKLLENIDMPVTLHVGEGQLVVDLDVIRLVTKLIDGRFPDYQRVVPEGGDKKVLANRERVRNALGRAAILANEKFRGVRLVLEDGRLRLQTNNPEHEEAEEDIEVDYSGGPLEIGFNVSYLLDALSAMSGEQFEMDLKSADASGLIFDPASPESKYVVMPMRL
jgi:DNA polymerase-3 subunit beta